MELADAVATCVIPTYLRTTRTDAVTGFNFAELVTAFVNGVAATGGRLIRVGVGDGTDVFPSIYDAATGLYLDRSHAAFMLESVLQELARRNHYAAYDPLVDPGRAMRALLHSPQLQTVEPTPPDVAVPWRNGWKMSRDMPGVGPAGAMVDFRPDLVAFSTLPVAYRPELIALDAPGHPSAPTVHRPHGRGDWDLFADYLVPLLGDDLLMTVRQLGAAMLNPTLATSMGKLIFAMGSGANGKSTFFAFMARMLGPARVVSANVAQMGTRWFTARLRDAFLVLGDDNPKSSRLGDAAVSNTKVIVTGGMAQAERKGQQLFDVHPHALVVQLVNDRLPYSPDDSDGFFRRLFVMQFTRTFKREADDIHLAGDCLTNPDVLDAMATWCADCPPFEAYHEPAGSAAALADYVADGDPMRLFWASMSPRYQGYYALLPQAVYLDYTDWLRRYAPNTKAPRYSARFSRELGAVSGWSSDRVRVHPSTRRLNGNADSHSRFDPISPVAAPDVTDSIYVHDGVGLPPELVALAGRVDVNAIHSASRGSGSDAMASPQSARLRCLMNPDVEGVRAAQMQAADVARLLS